MSKLKIILKRFWFPFLLFFLDALIFQQGIIAVITALTVIFYFVPRTFFVLKDREKFIKNTENIVIYGIVAIAVILCIQASHKIAAKRADIVISALEKYNEEYRHYPSDLKQLTPDFLSKVPKAKPTLMFSNFFYTSLDDGYILAYTVYKILARKLLFLNRG
ncbi:MAG: hypothetical protein ABIH00_03995 [Armatimonadota bacterium]